MHFDDEATATEYSGYMRSYFRDVYAPEEDLFFQRCLFVCDADDTPIATCFGWKSYGRVNTIHWFKVKKPYEGLGIGRALLSIVMTSFDERDYPIYLHTQPSSYRAIKLYSDFGFALLTDPEIGYRSNDLEEGLAYLKAHMRQLDFAGLRFEKAPADFLEAVKSSGSHQF